MIIIGCPICVNRKARKKCHIIIHCDILAKCLKNRRIYSSAISRLVSHILSYGYKVMFVINV